MSNDISTLLVRYAITRPYRPEIIFKAISGQWTDTYAASKPTEILRGLDIDFWLFSTACCIENVGLAEEYRPGPLARAGSVPHSSFKTVSLVTIFPSLLLSRRTGLIFPTSCLIPESTRAMMWRTTSSSPTAVRPSVNASRVTALLQKSAVVDQGSASFPFRTRDLSEFADDHVVLFWAAVQQE